MILSKSLGYALRGVLYIAAVQDEKKYIDVKEIAEQLDIPRHFLGKVLKRLAKHGMVDSAKGHAGGYCINAKTLQAPVMELIGLIEGDGLFNTCVIGFKKCNEQNPCPLHDRIAVSKNEMIKVFNEMRIGDLLKTDKPAFLKSLVNSGYVINPRNDISHSID